MTEQVQTLWGREPIMIIAFVEAIIALAVAFGLDLSAEQVGTVMAATAAVLGLLQRSRVSPV